MSLVSIVMPVLNAAPFLAEAIDSILGQTHAPTELIVVDDGSDDGSRDIAAGCAQRDARVRLLCLERDTALTSGARAANAGIALARGSYVARMDADDVALPERLATQLAFLKEHRLDVCGTGAIAFGSDETYEYRYPATHAAIEHELIFRVGLLHPTMIATAELMKRLPYDEATAHDDYEWQTRALAAGARFGNCPGVLLRRRHHEGQSNVVSRRQFYLERRAYRFRHVYRLFPRTPAREYQIVHALAEGARLADRAELEIAGCWFERLADVPDPGFRRSMARRWERVCDLADVPGTEDLRERVAAVIRSGED